MRLTTLLVAILILVPRTSHGKGDVAMPKSLSPNQLAILTSKFGTSIPQKPPTVWALVQANVMNTGQSIGGFIATAWVLAHDTSNVYFVTADHAIAPAVFSRAEAVRTDVFLAHHKGSSIRITASQVSRFPDIDAAFITIPKKHLFNSTLANPVRINTGIYTTDLQVRNIGFPDRASKTVRFSYNLAVPRIAFNKGPWEQHGVVARTGLWSTNARDVKISNANSFIVNYSSEPGFSGGPLVATSTGEVIGMMSHVVPDKSTGMPTKTVAIHVKELVHCLQILARG